MSVASFKNLEPQSGVPGGALGAKLRQRRRQLDLSLGQVAALAQCSESMVSKIETGKVSPSLALLRRLAAALSVNVSAMFDDAVVSDVVQRAGARPRLGAGALRRGDGISLESLAPHGPSTELQANIHTVEVGGASEEMISHVGEEVGYVIEGVMELKVEDTVWRLFPGDSFYFRSERPHGYRNAGDVALRILWVNTPPTF